MPKKKKKSKIKKKPLKKRRVKIKKKPIKRKNKIRIKNKSKKSPKNKRKKLKKIYENNKDQKNSSSELIFKTKQEWIKNSLANKSQYQNKYNESIKNNNN